MSMDTEALKDYLNNVNSKTKDQGGGGGSDLRWFKLPKDTGLVKLRFLGPHEGSKVPGMAVFKHWQMVNDKGEQTSQSCFKTHNLPCPICEILEKYEGRADLSDYEAAVQSAFNVLVLEDPEDRNRSKTLPHILTANGKYPLEWLIQNMLNPDVGNICDWTLGHDVTMQRERAGGKFNRTVVLKPRPVAESDAEIEEIKKNMYNLDKIWKEPDDAAYKRAKMLAGTLEDKIQNELLAPATGPAQTRTMPETKAAPATTTDPALTPGPHDAAPADPVTDQVAKPADAPDCFGDASVYNDTRPECVECTAEFHCQQKIEAGA